MSGRNTCIMGIDPGASGALAFIFTDAPDMVSVEDMPVAAGRVCGAQIGDTLRRLRPDFAIVELVGARPGQGVSSMFNFGCSFGTAIGAVTSNTVPLHFVSPAKWKKHFGLIGADKEASRALALRLWPARTELFARKKDSGRAEAALIARYGLETRIAQVAA